MMTPLDFTDDEVEVIRTALSIHRGAVIRKIRRLDEHPNEDVRKTALSELETTTSALNKVHRTEDLRINA